MENNTPNNELTHYQMELLLPDYVLGKLDHDEVIMFESNLLSYPDIASEVAEARNVFAKIEKMDLDSKNLYRSKNVSVKVQDRLAHRLKPQLRFRFVFRFILPTVALIALAVLVINSPNFEKKSSTPEHDFASYRIPAIFDSGELFQIFDSGNEDGSDYFDSESDKSEVSGFAPDSLSDLVISDYYYDRFYDGYYDEYFDEYYDEIEQSGDYYPLNYINFETKDLNRLDEDYFQQILKELENVDINS